MVLALLFLLCRDSFIDRDLDGLDFQPMTPQAWMIRRRPPAAGYDRGNRIAAELILSQPLLFAGLPLLWAQTFLERNPDASTDDYRTQRLRARSDKIKVEGKALD